MTAFRMLSITIITEKLKHESLAKTAVIGSINNFTSIDFTILDKKYLYSKLIIEFEYTGVQTANSKNFELSCLLSAITMNLPDEQVSSKKRFRL